MVQLKIHSHFWIATSLVVIIAGLISIFAISTQLIFSYDQARDAYETYDIWHNHDIKIIGPSSDIPGVFHGPLWYYLLAIPYSISNNNPLVAASLFATLQLLTIPLSGWLAYQLFKEKTVAVLTAFFYGFSPLFLASVRWLSNPIIAIIVMPFLLYFLFRFLNREKGKVPFILGICLGLMIQADLAYILFLASIPIQLFYFRYFPPISSLLQVGLGLVFTVSTYILAEAKFHGQGLSAILNFLQQAHSTRTVQEIVTFSLSRFEQLISDSVLPMPPLFLWGIILGVVLLFGRKRSLKKREFIFLFLWVLMLFVVTVFSTGVAHSSFIFFPLLLPTIMMFSYLISNAFSSKLQIIVFSSLIILLQLTSTYQWLHEKFLPFPAQQRTFYSDATRVVDYTYQNANSKPFAINSITVPLHYNATWSFFYEFYGKSKYGYVPYWAGVPSATYIRSLQPITDMPTKRFLIIEPRIGIPEYVLSSERNNEDAVSRLIGTTEIGEYIVEEREVRER